jgi:hypothetical protein
MARAVEAAIDDLELEATDEDVAEFLRAKIPELATKRRQIVQKALDAARARDKAVAPSQPSLLDDALAPTLFSGKPEPAAATPPPSKKQLHLVTGHEDSKVTPRATLLVGETQRGGGIVWVLFLLIVGGLGAAAWFVWPGGARLRQAFSTSAEPPQSAAPPPSAPPSAPLPSAEPVVVLELDASADVAAPEPPHSARSHHTWPTPSASPRFFFDAASILAPPPAPADAGAPGDDNNPYN